MGANIVNVVTPGDKVLASKRQVTNQYRPVGDVRAFFRTLSDLNCFLPTQETSRGTSSPRF